MPPRRGRLSLGYGNGRFMDISIHAPAKGATQAHEEGLIHFHISIHAPAKGATQPFLLCRHWTIYFYSRPREGGDRLPRMGEYAGIHFYSRPREGGAAHFYNFYFHMRSTFVYHAQCNKFTIYISNIKYSYIVRNYCAVPPHFHVRQTYAQLFITTKVLPLQCFFSFQKYQSYFYKNSLIDKI